MAVVTVGEDYGIRILPDSHFYLEGERTDSSSVIHVQRPNDGEVIDLHGNFTLDDDGNAVGGTVTDIVTSYQGETLSDYDLASTPADLSTFLDRNTDSGVYEYLFRDNDVITLGEVGDQVFGYDGDDRIYGEGGKDFLSGGAGDDILDGGSGSDTMSGGVGDDTYYVGNAKDTAYEKSGEGYDTVRSSVSYVLGSNIERLILTGHANLDGTGSSGRDRISGNDGDNHLVGGDGNDSLYGGDGNDKLDGSGGHDRLVGGHGDDVYYVDSKRDTVVEWKNEGTDTVNTTVSYTLTSNVENLQLSGTKEATETGNNLGNKITGNDSRNVLWGLAGNDVLEGKNGDDDLHGGAGADVLDGGLGRDTFFFADGEVGHSQKSADAIKNFKSDMLDLNGLDAIAGAGRDAFAFIGRDSFSGHAGELAIVDASGSFYLEADTNGDARADWYIRFDHAVSNVDANSFTSGSLV